MKPAWDQLGSAFKESDTILIGDVDCTASINKELCSTHGVKGCEYFGPFVSKVGKAGLALRLAPAGLLNLILIPPFSGLTTEP